MINHRNQALPLSTIRASFACAALLLGAAWLAAPSARAADPAPAATPDFNARYLEAEMALNAGDPAQARAALETAIAAENPPDFIYIAQAQALDAQSKGKEAQDTLDTGMKKHPESIDLMMARATLDRGAGRVNEAIAGLDQVLVKSPLRQDALEMLSDLHLSRLISNPSGSDADVKELIKIYNTMLQTRQGTDRLVPLLVLSTLYQKTSEFDKAVECSAEALKLNHHSSRIFEAHASALDADGKTEEAIKTYATALVALPDDDELEQKAEAYVKLKGGDDRAARFFVELASDNPDKVGVQQAAAHALMDAKRWPEAETCLRRVLAKNPDDLSNELSLLHVWMEMGRADEAVSEARKLGDAGGDLAPVITLSVAEALEGQGKRSEAMNLLQDYNAKHPLNENITLGLAALLLEDKQKEKAIGLLENLKTKVPDNFTAVSLLAGIYADGERYDDARKMLDGLPEKTRQEHASDVGLINAGLYVNQAVQLENKKSYPEALGMLDQADKLLGSLGEASTEPGRRKALNLKTSILLSRGEIHQMQGDTKGAESAYRQALALNPADAETWNGMGYYYADTNQKLDEAETMIKKALEIKPDAPHIVDSLGWVYYRQGKFKESIEQLEKAVKAIGDDPAAAEIHNHLGDAYAKAGRADDAHKAWQKALDLKGDADTESIKKKLAGGAI